MRICNDKTLVCGFLIWRQRKKYVNGSLNWDDHNTHHSRVLETSEGSSRPQKCVECLGQWPFDLTLVALEKIVEKHFVHDFRSQWVGTVIRQTHGSRFSVQVKCGRWFPGRNHYLPGTQYYRTAVVDEYIIILNPRHIKPPF